jgi:hypothetical protein
MPLQAMLLAASVGSVLWAAVEAQVGPPVCPCDACLAAGTTLAQCQAFGIDCTCLTTTCPHAADMSLLCAAARRASIGNCFVCLMQHAEFTIGCDAAVQLAHHHQKPVAAVASPEGGGGL